MLEDIARNCSLRFEHIEALNLSSNMSVLMRLYNMCEHTWDPDKTWDVYYWEELLPPLVVYMLTFLTGIVGNVLIIVAILGYRKMKTPTNIFLASLAFADMLLCIVCIPVKVLTITVRVLLCDCVYAHIVGSSSMANIGSSDRASERAPSKSAIDLLILDPFGACAAPRCIGAFTKLIPVRTNWEFLAVYMLGLMRTHREKPTLKYSVSLEISLLNSIPLPSPSFQLAELFSFSWTFGYFLCKFVNYMQNVSAISSVLNLTVMSLER